MEKEKENNNQINKNEEKEKENQTETESQPGFFSKYFYFILFFIAFQIGMWIIKSTKDDPNDPKLTCIFEEGTKFDVNFYLSPKDHYSVIKDSKPIYTIKDMKFSYENYSSNSLDNEINITYNISYLYRRKNHKNSALYLIAEIKLGNDVFKQLNQYYGLEKQDLIRSMNILKYVEDLSGLLNSAKDIDDINAGRDFKQKMEENKTLNNNNKENIPIPKLYYKNNFYLYMIRSGKKQGLTLFQTLSIMRVPMKLNTQKMEYVPIISLSDFWSMDSELRQINKTSNGIFNFTLYLSFNYIRSYFFNNMLGIQINEKIMYEKLSISGTKDILVELIKNNSTFYLIILFTVNTLHTIFSYLGFSSDISYYKNLKKLDGVYTKYIFFNIFYMFITFIYILLQGANFLVKIELFISFVIEFWKLKGMEEFVAALGLEDALIPSKEHIDISDEKLTILRYTIDEDIRQTENTIREGENILFNSDTLLRNNGEDEKFANKIINELDEKLSNMSEEERNEYFKKMGFLIEPKTISEEGKKLANKIANELEEKLNGMTDEELEAHLRELGFFQDTMPDNIKERAQINKKIVKAKRISNK